MKELYTFIFANLKSFGELTKAHFYDNDFANIEFESDNGEYELTIRRIDKEENKDGYPF